MRRWVVSLPALYCSSFSCVVVADAAAMAWCLEEAGMLIVTPEPTPCPGHSSAVVLPAVAASCSTSAGHLIFVVSLQPASSRLMDFSQSACTKNTAWMRSGATEVQLAHQTAASSSRQVCPSSQLESHLCKSGPQSRPSRTCTQLRPGARYRSASGGAGGTGRPTSFH